MPRLLLLACVVLVGCMAPRTRMTPLPRTVVEAEEAKQRRLALETSWAEQARLDDVAFPILSQAIHLCPKAVRPILGLRYGTAAQFEDIRWREAAVALGLGDTLTVLSVTREGPADIAGVRPGDRVLEVNGKPIPTGGAAVKEISRIVDAWAEGAEQPLTLTIERAGIAADLTIARKQACAYPAVVDPDHGLNAFADGSSIMVTSGMMRFADDDELRVVIAHEFAHNAMGHLDAKRGNSLFGALLGALGDIFMATQGINTGGYYASQGAAIGAQSFSQDFEREADYVGMYALAATGVPLDRALRFWRHFAQANPEMIGLAYTHPTSAERFVRMERAIAEIESKRERGLALTPEAELPGIDAEPTAAYAAAPLEMPKEDSRPPVLVLGAASSPTYLGNRGAPASEPGIVRAIEVGSAGTDKAEPVAVAAEVTTPTAPVSTGAGFTCESAASMQAVDNQNQNRQLYIGDLQRIGFVRCVQSLPPDLVRVMVGPAFHAMEPNERLVRIARLYQTYHWRDTVHMELWSASGKFAEYLNGTYRTDPAALIPRSPKYSDAQ